MERRSPMGAEEIIKKEECLLQMEERLIWSMFSALPMHRNRALLAAAQVHMSKRCLYGRVVYLPRECVIMIVVGDCVNLSDLVFVVLKYLLVFIHS